MTRSAPYAGQYTEPTERKAERDDRAKRYLFAPAPISTANSAGSPGVTSVPPYPLSHSNEMSVVPSSAAALAMLS